MLISFSDSSCLASRSCIWFIGPYDEFVTSSYEFGKEGGKCCRRGFAHRLPDCWFSDYLNKEVGNLLPKGAEDPLTILLQHNYGAKGSGTLALLLVRRPL
jgi:hypothetical protein